MESMKLNQLSYITAKKIPPICETQTWTAELDFHYHDGSVHKRKVKIHAHTEQELDFLCNHMRMAESITRLANAFKEVI